MSGGYGGGSSAAAAAVAEVVVEPWDFGPPTGRGMRATRKLAAGETVLRIPTGLCVTPQRCRKLLLRWSSTMAYGDPTPPPSTTDAARFSCLADASVGSVAAVLDNDEEVLAACREVGIDSENDKVRRGLLGVVMLIVSADESDSSVELRKLDEPDGETVWFAATALARPSLQASINTMSDENVLVTALLAARTWRERVRQSKGTEAEAEAAASAAAFEADEQECCPGLTMLVAEMPSEVGMYAEWSDEELKGLDGSLHAAVARRARADVQLSRALVRAAFKGAVPDLGAAERQTVTLLAPFWGMTDADYMWAWVRVASRHRSREVYPNAVTRDEGKTFMVPGGTDMFNHSLNVPTGKSTRESSDWQFIEVVAHEDYAEGDEVFCSYGYKGNHELLFGYGFALDGNPHDRVELQLTLESLSATGPSTLRPELCLHCLELGGAAGNCERLPERPGCDLPEVCVKLSAADPVPGALLGLIRMERLSEQALATLDSKLGRAELVRKFRTGESLEQHRSESGAVPLDLVDIDAQCTALRCEAQGLTSLRQLFVSMLEAYPAEVASGSRAESRGRALCCAALCSAEQSILKAALKETERLLAKAVRSSLDAARQLAAPSKGSSDSSGTAPILRHLASRRGRVEASAPEVVQLFQHLSQRGPRDALASAAIWTQTASFFFLLLHGAVDHPLVDMAVPDVPECWAFGTDEPSSAARLQALAGGATLGEGSYEPRLWEAWGAPPPIGAPVPDDGDFLKLFRAKTSMWGCYLLAQFLTCGAVNAQAVSDMAAESLDIRKRHAWSVPTPEAVTLIAAEGSLVELGAGSGLWAELLRRAGAKVFAYSEEATEGSVEQGGPDKLQGMGAECKALVLMWPDWGGKGTFGLECVKRWVLEEQGRRLVCVGEWGGGGTLGSISEDLPERGQSFSEECQSFVEAHFRLVHTLALPNWPLMLDAVRVFERTS